MKRFLYIILILVGGNLMAQETNKETIHHKFTTINNFREFDKYGVFETDDGIQLKVATKWFAFFHKYHNPNEEKGMNFIFYNKKNEFLSFGVVYDDPITHVGLPDEEGNVEVLIMPCPTPFKLYKNNPNFNKLYKLLKELKKSKGNALVGARSGRYFHIIDIKKLCE